MSMTRLSIAAVALALAGTIASAQQVTCRDNRDGTITCHRGSSFTMFDQFNEAGSDGSTAYMRDQEAIRRLRMQDLQIQQMEQQLRHAPQAAADHEVYANIDSPGNDIEGIRGLELKTCVAHCQNTPGCVAVSWVEQSTYCWTKGAIGQPMQKAGVITVIRGY